jgi:hypothetical protein
MSPIITLNARSDLGLTSFRDYLGMSSSQFKRYIGAHHTLLVDELATSGVTYESLGPALVPTTGDRREIALLFNIDLLSDGAYGRAVSEILIPLLNRQSTLSVLAGDILCSPDLTRRLAQEAVFVPGSTDDWGRQYIYCVYLNNLSIGQMNEINAAFMAYPFYLGYVATTYASRFRTLLSTMLPAIFLKHRHYMLVNHGGDEPWVSDINEISYPFSENNYQVVSVNAQLFSPLLSYKIPTEVLPMYEEDVHVSLNAISDTPLELDGFEVLLPEAKFGYLKDNKGGILKVAGLDDHSSVELAAVIRAQLKSNYVYRLQHNRDDTVQFSVVLELPREDSHPVKVAVGLKYFPDSKKLSLVTLT